jgi:hypothetical protein
LHLGQIVSGGHLEFLRRGESNQKIVNLGFTLCGEHLLYGASDAIGALNTVNMGQNLQGQGLQEVGEDQLVARDPICIERIHLHCRRGVVSLLAGTSTTSGGGA